jgi:S1-C subfamily serine protease
MRPFLLVATLAATYAAAPAVQAQSRLEEVETRLQEEGAVAPSTEAEPGSGYLGMVPDEERPPPNGVRVQRLTPRAPAEAGGLRVNDIITAIDDTSIRNVDDLDVALQRATAGQRWRVTVQRSGRTESMNVTLGERPSATVTDDPADAASRPSTATPTEDPAPAPRPSLAPPLGSSTAPRTTPALPADPTAPADAPSTERPSLIPPAGRSLLPDVGPPAAERLGLDVPSVDLPAIDDNPEGDTGGLPEPADGRGRASLGLTVVPLTEDARAIYGLGSVRRGALITAVRPGSAAEAAGLPVGGVIVRFDSRQIDSADDLVDAVRDSRAGEEVELTLWQGDSVRRLPVRLAPAGVASIPTLPPSAPPLPAPRPAGPSTVRPGLGATNGRPLLSRVERAVENLTQRPPSTVYNPSEMASLQQQVFELTNQVRALEDRVKALEGGGEGTPSSTANADADATDTTVPGATTPLTLPTP